MSTPKEKAQELVNTYRMILMDEDTDCGNELLCTSIAIKNAVVAVNEIIDAIDWHEFETPNKELNYWLDVRKEIKKL
jgi:hypothetical protein